MRCAESFISSFDFRIIDVLLTQRSTHLFRPNKSDVLFPVKWAFNIFLQDISMAILAGLGKNVFTYFCKYFVISKI